MILSINPSYFCNFRCDFCYLTEQQLGDKQIASIERIMAKVTEVQQHQKVRHVDIYGGEPLMFPKGYLTALVTALRSAGISSVGVNTNLSGLSSEILNVSAHISVSYDFDAREKSSKVYENMQMLTRPFSILMLASEKVLALDVEKVIKKLNALEFLETVDIKPYSTNQANQHAIAHKDYERFVRAMIEAKTPKRFKLVNEDILVEAVTGQRNAFSDDHLYITPQAELAVLEFDLNDNEYFLTMKDYSSYEAWCHREKRKIEDHPVCGNCQFKGTCLSEHLRDKVEPEQGCNGFYNLIKWFAQERMPRLEYKNYQELYARLVQNHTDEIADQASIVHQEIVENAKNYFLHKDPVAIYPAKAYATACIYATLLAEHYGGSVYDYLNDDQLFPNSHQYFVPYRLAKQNYDAILAFMQTLPNWRESGWAPYTVNYFRLECTEEGLNEVSQCIATGKPLPMPA